MDSNEPIQPAQPEIPTPETPAKKHGGGPRTPEGKRASSRNAVKHNCCSKNVLLTGESKAEFDEQYQMWLDRFSPGTGVEFLLVEQVAIDYWRFKRSEACLHKIEDQFHSAQPDRDQWTGEQIKKLDTFRRYKTADYNQFQKSKRAIEQLRKDDWHETNQRASQTERAYENQHLPEERREFKQIIRTAVSAPPPLPTVREDGGCECPSCLTKWGVQELKLSQERRT